MGLSGKLLEESNTVNGVVVKYSEPPEARKPRTRWRLYVFKGNEELPILYIHRQSAYLLGRDRKVYQVHLFLLCLLELLYWTPFLPHKLVLNIQ